MVVLRRLPALFLPFAVCLVWSGCAADQSPRTSESPQSQTLEDVIPLTSANLRGHRMLYDEGWYVITSSRKSLEYAKEKSVSSSRVAMQEASRRMAERECALAHHFRHHGYGLRDHVAVSCPAVRHGADHARNQCAKRRHRDGRHGNQRPDLDAALRAS